MHFHWPHVLCHVPIECHSGAVPKRPAARHLHCTHVVHGGSFHDCARISCVMRVGRRKASRGRPGKCKRTCGIPTQRDGGGAGAARLPGLVRRGPLHDPVEQDRGGPR